MMFLLLTILMILSQIAFGWILTDIARTPNDIRFAYVGKLENGVFSFESETSLNGVVFDVWHYNDADKTVSNWTTLNAYWSDSTVVTKRAKALHTLVNLKNIRRKFYHRHSSRVISLGWDNGCDDSGWYFDHSYVNGKRILHGNNVTCISDVYVADVPLYQYVVDAYNNPSRHNRQRECVVLKKFTYDKCLRHIGKLLDLWTRWWWVTAEARPRVPEIEWEVRGSSVRVTVDKPFVWGRPTSDCKGQTSGVGQGGSMWLECDGGYSVEHVFFNVFDTKFTFTRLC